MCSSDLKKVAAHKLPMKVADVEYSHDRRKILFYFTAEDRVDFRELVRDLDLAVIIVTHDMAVARLMADRLLVMRRGQVVETGLTDQVLDDPQHAYTQLLVSSVLQI